MKKILIITFVCIVGFLVTTLASAEEKQSLLQEGKEDNLFILASNESAAVSAIDIKIYIDGVLVVDDYLDHEAPGGTRIVIAPKKHFQFKLAHGIHKINVVSVIGEASLEKDIEINDKCYMAISYWYNPDSKRGSLVTRKFNIHIQDKPLLYDEVLR